MKSTALAKILVVTLAVVAITATGCRSKRPDKNITPIPGAGLGDVNPEGPDGGVMGEEGATNPNILNNGVVPPITSGASGTDLITSGPGGIPPYTGPSTTPTNPDVGSLGMDPSVPVTENTEIWAQNTVNFDFDSSVVRASEVYKLTDIANTLVGSPHLGVKVEGHCDERGTEEYNRALGERRANSVRDYLIDAGVGPNQIRTLSYGEDMPADLAHDEAAWAANRRAVFVLLTPKR